VEPPLDQRNLDLTYPCSWSYTLFGKDEEQLRTAIAPLLVGLDHRIESSRRSRTGKYVSLSLEVTVRSNEERLGLFRQLHELPEVVYLL